MLNSNTLAEERNSFFTNDLYNFIAGINFIQVGFVTNVYSDDDGYALRCDARAFALTPDKQERNYYGLELIFPGTAKVGVRYPVEQNDCVLILGMKHYHEELVADGATEPMPANVNGYSPVTLKALPLQPNARGESTVRLDVTDDGIALQSDVPVSLTLTDDDHTTIVVDDEQIAVNEDTVVIKKGEISLNGGDVIVKDGEFNVFNGHLKVV